jgi:hypothetical protein
MNAVAMAPGLTSTATAAGTTTLTVTSTQNQEFTGTTTQTVVLPVCTTLSVGHQYNIINNSTGALTVNSSGGNLVQTLSAGMRSTFTCVLASGTTAASWAVPDEEYISASTACTGALTDAVVWTIQKQGREVILKIPVVTGTASNVTAFTYGLTIPAKYRPTASVFQSAATIVNGTGQAVPGWIEVASSGVISVYRDGTIALGWGTAANTGLLGETYMTWFV